MTIDKLINLRYNNYMKDLKDVQKKITSYKTKFVEQEGIDYINILKEYLLRLKRYT